MTDPTNSRYETGSILELDAAESIGLITEAYKKLGGRLGPCYIPPATPPAAQSAQPRIAPHRPAPPAATPPPDPSPSPSLSPRPPRMGPRPAAPGAALALLGIAAAAAAARSLPLPDAGPHVNYGWGEPIRLRHLYTASKHGLFSCFLRIGGDGRVDAVGSQSPQSECRALRDRTGRDGTGRDGRAGGGAELTARSLSPQVCWRSAPWRCAPWPSRACRAPATSAWTRRGGCTGR